MIFHRNISGTAQRHIVRLPNSEEQHFLMETCIFCVIVAGRSPASVVHRDDDCLAVMDICPVNAGHLLVIPVKHATYLADNWRLSCCGGISSWKISPNAFEKHVWK